MLFYKIGIFAQGGIHIGEDDAQFLKVFAHLVIDGLALVLSRNTSQIFLFGLRNTKAIKCILNFGRNVVPRFALLWYGLNIVIDIVEIDA